MNNKYLYLPLEIFNRELNGMLLFSLVAAQKGWKVVIGGKKTIFPLLRLFPPGVVLLKSVVPGEVEIQDMIIGCGHKITSLDAEGLVPSNGRSGVELRYSKESIEKSNLLFFWGKNQFNQVKKVFPCVEKNGFATGSPIFDYWRLLKRLSAKTGHEGNKKKILIATSFPYANHCLGPEQAYNAVRDASGEKASPAHIREIFMDGELQEYVYPKFRKMVEALSNRLPTHEIILRPHPSETPKSWEKIARSNDNVTLQCGGEISNWLLDCDFFIHFNSTTSIEACYYEKEVIAFVPKLDKRLFDRLSPYPLLASQVFETNDEVIDFITGKTEQVDDGDSLDMNEIIEGADSDHIVFSSSKIISFLEEMVQKDSGEKMPSVFKLVFSFDYIKVKMKLRVIWFLGWLDYLFKMFSGRYSSMRNFYKYGKTKQGKLKKKRLISTVRQLAKVLRVHEKTCRIKKIKSGLFLIENSDEAR